MLSKAALLKTTLLHTVCSAQGGILTRMYLQMRPSVQELLCMPYVSQYIAKYAKHIMQLSAQSGRTPSLDLDKLPVIAQICR